MGDVEASRLQRFGFPVAIDEPYQHYQFAGRGDLVAWSLHNRALLHIENRTRFPDLQDAIGAYNAKCAYLADSVAKRLGLRDQFRSVTHVLALLWSAELRHLVRLRTATFRAVRRYRRVRRLVAGRSSARRSVEVARVPRSP